MIKKWLGLLGTITFFVIPFVFALILIMGDLSINKKGISLLSALVLASTWYIVYLMKSDKPALKSLQLFIIYLLKQLPNILQIITFAGFVAFFYSAKEASTTISFLTTTLTCFYLTMNWREYFHQMALEEKLIEKYDRHFRNYTLALFWILFILLSKATAQLLS